MSLEYSGEIQNSSLGDVENAVGTVTPVSLYKKSIGKKENGEEVGDYLSIKEIERRGANLILHYDWCGQSGNAWLDWKMNNDEYIRGFVG